MRLAVRSSRLSWNAIRPVQPPCGGAVKAAELEAERLQQETLAATVLLPPADGPAAELARDNLWAYASGLSPRPGRADIEVLLGRICPARRGTEGTGMSRDGRPRRIVVGITGASGAIYGVRLLELLRSAGLETHLVMSPSARITLVHETALKSD